VEGDIEQADVIRVFYDEYLAVNDLPAEFYLETVQKVFQTYDLARGALTVPRPHRADTEAIRRTALLTVEGERDDICASARRWPRRTCARHPPLPEDAPHPDRRGPLRRVQRQASGTSRSTRACGR
jgi:polyhydroxyalkanoate depolymerase